MSKPLVVMGVDWGGGPSKTSHVLLHVTGKEPRQYRVIHDIEEFNREYRQKLINDSHELPEERWKA